MSITPINHYAITSGQPGIINEEAYTVLDLVGKCGSKVNECIASVNDVDDRMSTAELQYGVVRQLAQQAVRDADAAKEAVESINTKNGYTYNLYSMNGCILNISENGDDEYNDTFLEYINEFIAKVLNDNSIYFDFTTFTMGNPITVHVAWGDPFNNGGDLENICVTGTLDFSIIAKPLTNVLGPGKPLITWQFTQTPVILNNEASGIIEAIYANGCTFFDADNYTADNPYDGQSFQESYLGAFIANRYVI